ARPCSRGGGAYAAKGARRGRDRLGARRRQRRRRGDGGDRRAPAAAGGAVRAHRRGGRPRDGRRAQRRQRRARDGGDRRARRRAGDASGGAAVIVCPSCQTAYDDNETRFCGRCGSDLGRLSSARTAQNPAIPDESRDRPGDRLIGATVDGRYRVLAKIGAGGMGAVYKVEHLAMGKLAAMKVLHPSLTQDREVAQRFRREAEAVSKLSSPNTVQVFDFGESGGSSYLVMELCKGEDLGAILRRDGPVPFVRLAPMMMQVCDALSEAHEAGIVHRDLKPENLIVSRARDGRDVLKVLDFGLAKLRDAEEMNAVTARGSLIG